MNYLMLYNNETDPLKKLVYENLISIKQLLVYLETKECRQNIDKELRLRKVKYATEMFRSLLKRKEELNSPIKIIVDRDSLYD